MNILWKISVESQDCQQRNCLYLKWVESQSYLLKQCRPKTLVSWRFPHHISLFPVTLRWIMTQSQQLSAQTQWLGFSNMLAVLSAKPPITQTKTVSIMDFARQIVPNINKSSSSLGKLVEESPTQTALWKKDVKTSFSLNFYSLLRGKDNGNLKLTWCCITAMSNMLSSVLPVCGESWKFFTTDVSDGYVRPFIQRLIFNHQLYKENQGNHKMKMNVTMVLQHLNRHYHSGVV